MRKLINEDWKHPKIGGKYLNKRGLNHLETRKEVFSLEPIMAKTECLLLTRFEYFCLTRETILNNEA